MPTLTEFCTINVKLNFQMIGKVPSGMRLDVPFTGTATSSHWDGEKPVSGVDYVTVGGGGRQSLDIRAQMGEGDDVVSYRATGVGGADGIQELLTFETASETFGFLNNRVGVATGTLEGNKLTLTVYLLEA